MGLVFTGRVGALIVACCVGLGAVAQSAPVVCGVPPIPSANSQANIFSDQQEQWLGDATADMLEREYKPARDAAQSAYLQAIVDKLAVNLPPSKLKFRVQMVDSSEINGFSLAGGYIYITRKLAAAAHNDDELAAVLGHEMGHIASHQFAFETTRDLKRLLNVQSVGDRADVYEKFQKLMDARYVDKHPEKGGDSETGQDQADKVGMYLVAAAGYRPAAFAEFWDRTTFTEGKTGGKLSDFFGMTKPDQKRLRGMLKLTAALPPGCGGKESMTSAGFEAWHSGVVGNQAVASAVHLASVSEVKLTPPLHMDLERVRFSPDGKTILAQDAASVFTIAREPFGVQFRFDAENALAAEFSPDSQKVVFATPGLHTEEWGISERKMLSAHEPIARHDCLDPKLSPDGRTVICVTLDDQVWEMNLALLDAATGAAVWEKKAFFQPTYLIVLLLSYEHSRESTQQWLPSSFSADGNTLLIGPGSSKLAFDMRTRTPVKIGDDLKRKVTGPYAFIGNDQIAGENVENVKDSGIFSFPEGKQIKKLDLPLPNMGSVSSVDGHPYILIAKTKEPGMSLADLGTGKLIVNSKTNVLDFWGGNVIVEGGDGTVMMGKLSDTGVTDQKKVTLPLSPLGGLRAIAISPDRKRIALSTLNHGGVWNLETGKEEFLTLGFTNAVWADDGSLYVESPKRDTLERHVMQMTMAPRAFKNLTYTVDDKVHMTFGRLIEWKQPTKNSWQLTMHNIADASVTWTKTFPDGTPKYTESYGGRELLFTSQLKLGSVKARLKANGTLANEALAVKDKDNGRLIEVVDATTGKTLAEMVLELPPNYDGTNGLNRAGDLLYMTASDNRTVVYSLSTGKQLRQIFGNVAAIDPETQRVCTANRRDEAVVYDADGKELAHFRGGSALRFADFRAHGTQLILLSADQVVRTVDVAKGDVGTAVAEK